MLSWEWPWLMVLLPMPLLVRWLSPTYDAASGAIRVPFYAHLQALKGEQQHQTGRRWLRALLLWSIWCLLICAVARPTWVGEPVTLPQEQRDLMLAVDISRSMGEVDMRVGNRYVNRIDAVKAVVGSFIQQRASDRIGLILFGQQGYLQTPLTYDRKTVKQQLQEAQLGFAGNATAIGDSIGLAIKHLRDRPAQSRVLILLTDGANTAGTDPKQASTVAAEADIRIHTIGVGAQGRRRSDLDEPTLKAIAQKTGGRYFRARNPQQLQQIYAELDRLEPTPQEQTFRPTRSLVYWPVLIALLLSALLGLLINRGSQ